MPRKIQALEKIEGVELVTHADKMDLGLGIGLDALIERFQRPHTHISEVIKGVKMLADTIIAAESARLERAKLEFEREKARMESGSSAPGRANALVDALEAVKSELAARKEDSPEDHSPERPRTAEVGPEPAAKASAGGAAAASELPRSEISEGDDGWTEDVPRSARGFTT